MSDARVTLARLPDCGYVNLRGDADDAAFRAAVESACGAALPGPRATASRDGLCIYWLGPDEWMLCTSAGELGALLAALDKAAAGLHVACNDLSGAFVTLRLGGECVCELLAKGCTLDLHPAAFAGGACAHTGLAKAGVLLAVHGEDFTLIVRRSFATYLLQWLQAAGAEYGIEFA